MPAAAQTLRCSAVPLSNREFWAESVQADEPSDELLLRELGRINGELAAQRRLNAMTVHDLSNPAQVILGLSEVLLEHQVLDPLVRRHLEQVHRSAVTMTRADHRPEPGVLASTTPRAWSSSGSTSSSW